MCPHSLSGVLIVWNYFCIVAKLSFFSPSFLTSFFDSQISPRAFLEERSFRCRCNKASSNSMFQSGHASAILWAALLVCLVVGMKTASARQSAVSLPSRPLSQHALVETLSDSKKVKDVVGVAKFLTSIVSTTSLRELIGIENANSIVVPLLGILHLPKDTISFKDGVVTLKVNIKGHDVQLKIYAGDDADFRISIGLPSSFADESVSAVRPLCLGERFQFHEILFPSFNPVSHGERERERSFRCSFPSKYSFLEGFFIK